MIDRLKHQRIIHFTKANVFGLIPRDLTRDRVNQRPYVPHCRLRGVSEELRYYSFSEKICTWVPFREPSVQGPEAGTLGVPDKTFLNIYMTDLYVPQICDSGKRDGFYKEYINEMLLSESDKNQSIKLSEA